MKKRMKCDFEIFFTDGGNIKGKDFIVDFNGDKVSEAEISQLIVANYNFKKVHKTIISNQSFLEHEQDSQSTTTTVDQHLYIDLSHIIEDGLVTYKGLPPPHICDYLTREESKKFYTGGDEFQIAKIEMVANTGTYIDCPFHRFKDGHDLTGLELKDCADLEGIVISVPFRNSLIIKKSDLEGHELKNKAVLFHTGWDEYWNTEKYYENHPYLTNEAAIYLRDSAVKLVGIDGYNVDDTQGKSRPVHTTLLAAKVLIVEHLCNLQLLPQSGFWFSAIPPKFRGVGSFPVRAMAKVYKFNGSG